MFSNINLLFYVWGFSTIGAIIFAFVYQLVIRGGKPDVWALIGVFFVISSASTKALLDMEGGINSNFIAILLALVMGSIGARLLGVWFLAKRGEPRNLCEGLKAAWHCIVRAQKKVLHGIAGTRNEESGA